MSFEYFYNNFEELISKEMSSMTMITLGEFSDKVKLACDVAGIMKSQYGAPDNMMEIVEEKVGKANMENRLSEEQKKTIYKAIVPQAKRVAQDVWIYCISWAIQFLSKKI